MATGSLLTGGAVGAAFAGAAIGAGISYASQAISGELNWGQFALDIGAGLSRCFFRYVWGVLLLAYVLR